MAVKNILTIDVEDWFHICGVNDYISRDDWPSLESRVVEIRPDAVVLRHHNGKEVTLRNAAVFCMTYSDPDIMFLQKLGLIIDNDHYPAFSEASLESSIPGLYIAGSLARESDIMKSRFHPGKILGRLQF